ncbi:DUF2306 domain-containing protein [Rhizobium sp. YK2]|uniref:DUF2306 domain-containing protein n=1 Tax=Rhizobium sp. YK2 TaxID=1860096 RepID=UPI00084C1564|nr:DUF2306 domain-containing protein [Rhizobium sp. YK2]OED00717.1 hypothetical protein A9Z06_12170 [Rhizobium sp. YK2]
MTAAPRSNRSFHSLAASWSAGLLVSVSWLSGVIFAAYIVVFFGGTVISGDAYRWNETLPGLYDPSARLSTSAIGAHFVAGSILVLLGPLQLIDRLRRRVPGLHRWLGRLYVVSAAVAGVGGLVFIVGQGTVGGTLMDVGFGLYGTLMVVTATMSYLHARSRRYHSHRAWAIRLFALTIDSWLYRIEYGAWFLMSRFSDYMTEFGDRFDAIMVFFFYVPNLIVAEFVIRAGRQARTASADLAASALFVAASAFIALVTLMFTAHTWGPGIASRLTL